METLFVSLKTNIMGAAGALLPAGIVPYLALLLNMLAILLAAPVLMMYLTWLERKVIARLQGRYGPNRVGWFGLLQPVADGIKMIWKEDIVPAGADKPVHLVAPVMMTALSLLLFTVVPFGHDMAAVDLNIGLVFFMAVASLEVVPVFMAGWGSRSKFALLGSMRAVAQMISYEIPLGLSLLAVVMASGSASLVEIVNQQQGWLGVTGWNVWTPWGIGGFILFFITGLAEVSRTPFDVPEGESEIVAGYHTEYSGFKFALLQMGEFLSAFAVCALTVVLFFGGWQGPVLPSWLWFISKTFFFFTIMIWIRGTLPRMRVDVMMSFAWKFLIPMTLVNLGIVTLWLLAPGAVAWPLGIGILVAAWQFFAHRDLGRTGPVLPLSSLATD